MQYEVLAHGTNNPKVATHRFQVDGINRYGDEHVRELSSGGRSWF